MIELVTWTLITRHGHMVKKNFNKSTGLVTMSILYNRFLFLFDSFCFAETNLIKVAVLNLSYPMRVKSVSSFPIFFLPLVYMPSVCTLLV